MRMHTDVGDDSGAADPKLPEIREPRGPPTVDERGKNQKAHSFTEQGITEQLSPHHGNPTA